MKVLVYGGTGSQARPTVKHADSAYKGPYVSDAIRRTGIKPGERRQNEAALLAS
jgi:hypothetical protein